MANLEEAFERMFRNIIRISEENQSLTENLPNYNFNLGKLKTAADDLQVGTHNQKFNARSVIKYKRQLKNKLIAFIVENALKLTSYAKLTGNQQLLIETKTKTIGFKNLIDDSLSDRARIIYNLAEPIIAELESSDISATTQKIFLTAINDYHEAYASPDLAALLRKRANENIAILLEQGYGYVADMAAAVEIIRFKEPDFYLGFKAAQKVTVKGKIRFSVKGKTIDTNNKPISMVKVTVTLDGEEILVKKTSTRGVFYIKLLATGTYLFSFKKSGYFEQTIVVNVNYGEITKVTALLAAA
jgi:hypothetical protein